ncbi:MAG: patatin-like phospholipase family protein [Rubrivivax sp.]|nr:patatin-like phospholipase family protein [Rubrivivax sp.]
MSSGALRGLAHVGVLRALEAEGIRPELIVGSSVGALIGAINASGVSAGISAAASPPMISISARTG